MMIKLSLLLLLLAAPIISATKEAAEAYFSSLSDSDKAPYQQWLDNNFSTYTRHSFLPASSDPSVGVAVFWKIIGDEIQFAVAVKASGWLGFGISEAGGMLGADVVTFTSANPSELVDSYIVESRFPSPDDCQNWVLLSSETSDNWIILEMKRALDTGDAQDHKLVNDKELWIPPTRLIAAWGESSDVGYHGLNSARSAVRIFDDSESSISSAQALQNTVTTESDGYVEVRENNHQIPATDTEYHYVCKTADEIKSEINLNQDTLTMVGAVPVISPETAQFVHHFTVYIQKDCSNAGLVKSMVYAWAPGDEGWSLPSNVGFPLFDTESRQALMLEIHYNNPGRVSGQLDSSGIRFYYSLAPRTHDAAVLELADPFVRLGGEKIDNGLTNYEFTCPGSCSSSFLWDGQGVTVLAEYLHMHQTGVRMTNEVIRNNQVVHKALVDVFEFDQQGSFKVQQDSYQIMPGDSFKTSCFYRNGSSFGISSQEEMCIAYVMYYPAKQFSGFPWMCPYGLNVQTCDQVVKGTSIDNEAQLGRTFGSAGSQCTMIPSPTSSPTSDAPVSYGPDVFPTMEPTKAPSPTLTPTKNLSSGGSPDPTAAPSKNPNTPTSVASTSPSATESETSNDEPAASGARGNSWTVLLQILATVLMASNVLAM